MQSVINCENRLANCCGDESVVARTARVNDSMTSELEAVSRKLGSRQPSAPDEGAVALTTVLGENSYSGSAQRKFIYNDAVSWIV